LGDTYISLPCCYVPGWDVSHLVYIRKDSRGGRKIDPSYHKVSKHGLCLYTTDAERNG
jgi:hypothetical protein